MGTLRLHFLFNVVTSVFFLPLLALYFNALRKRKGIIFDATMGAWLTLASTMYHWTERVEGRTAFGIGEMTWHVMDNMGAQTGICLIMLHPVNFRRDEEGKLLMIKNAMFIVHFVAQ